MLRASRRKMPIATLLFSSAQVHDMAKKSPSVEVRQTEGHRRCRRGTSNAFSPSRQNS